MYTGNEARSEREKGEIASGIPPARCWYFFPCGALVSVGVSMRLCALPSMSRSILYKGYECIPNKFLSEIGQKFILSEMSARPEIAVGGVM